MKKVRNVCIFSILVLIIMLVGCKNVQAAETLFWPVPGHPYLSQELHKNAIDISDANIEGANVHAAMGGTVTHIHLCTVHHPGNYKYDTCNGFGTGLVIAGDDGRIYQYAHMQANSIPSNVYRTARVEKGQLIGRVGQTGAATGPHLHFGISIGSYDADSGINPDTETYSNRYSSTKPNIPSNLLNLGNNFYSYILMSNNLGLFNVDVGSQVVLQNGVWQDKKQIWNFIRQSDGSYVIKNVATGKYLDVFNSNDYDGGAIRTFTYNGSNAQKFFLYGTQDNCVIRPACSATRTVSVDGGVNLAGKKLNMWEYWGVETQLFYIWKVNEAKASVLNYNANRNDVTLNWTKGENADKYNIIINSGTAGNVKEYKKIIDIAETSYKISLPAGYYEVTVEGWNYFSHDFSNVVKFTIANPTYPLQSITLNKTTSNLKVGGTDTLKVTYKPTNTTDNKTVTWSSSNTKVVAVDKTGTVKGIKEGTAIITAKVGTKTATCKVTVEYKLPFKDVAKSDWFYEPVKWAYKNKVVTGYNETTFAPNDKTSRGQLVTILWRLEGKPDTSKLKNNFTDVPNTYYTDAIKWANSKGIVTGYGGTTKFGPEDRILRQDLALILMRYAKYKGKDTKKLANISGFADYKKAQNYAETAIRWAVQNSIIQGNKKQDGTKTLDPQSNATRAEIVTMLMRYCQK